MVETRDLSIDMLKGIGILFMIFGHCINWRYTSSFIYSFHMPLFFFISGYLYKKNDIKTQVKKDYQRLVVPYLLVSAILMLSRGTIGLASNNMVMMKDTFLSLLFAAGGSHSTLVFGNIKALTQLWFLWALFWARLFVWVLPEGIKGVMIGIFVSIVAYFVGRYVIFLPLDLNEGLAASVFVLAGKYYKEYSCFRQDKIIAVMCILLWLISIFFCKRLILASCIYDNYPVQVLGALGGIVVIWQFLRYFVKMPKLSKMLAWIGMNSLTILCLHTLETHTLLFWRAVQIVLPLPTNGVVWFLYKVSFCIAGLVILSRCKYLVKTLGIVNWSHVGK